MTDPRKVDAGAKALAERMGCTNPSDWKLFRGEARAVLEAAESVDVEPDGDPDVSECLYAG